MTVPTDPAHTVSRRLFALMGLATLACGCDGSRPENELRERIERYEKGWAEQDFAAVWQLMSPRLQEGNDNDESKFESFVRSSGALMSSIDIEEIRFAGDRAYVRTLASYTSLSGEPLGSQLEESHWIRIGDTWFFDGYRLLREIPR